MGYKTLFTYGRAHVPTNSIGHAKLFEETKYQQVPRSSGFALGYENPYVKGASARSLPPRQWVHPRVEAETDIFATMWERSSSPVSD